MTSVVVIDQSLPEMFTMNQRVTAEVWCYGIRRGHCLVTKNCAGPAQSSP